MEEDKIREAFLRFFEKRGHKIYESISLIPQDPSILFTVAGMVAFKDFFLGKEKPENPRAASSQRCIRTNDLPKIGKTARHLTFFEMLGNFSFGDYFKDEAISFAWEFLTKDMSIPKNKLYVSIFKDDNEAEKIWKGYVSSDRIVRLGEKDNFWKMGDVGPCGPCSEIIFDMGEDVGCKSPNCMPGCDCDRFLELWNLVFTEFTRKEDGSLIPLPKKNIDTGMGLERLSIIISGKTSSFECGLIAPIVERINAPSASPSPLACNIIGDHIRAITHLIYDGIIPSNEERGYVLRSLIRKAERQGKSIEINEPFLYKLVYPVSLIFPYLKNEESHIANIIKLEEERFYETYNRGLSILYERIEKSKDMFSGKEIFKLYDTYGFPPEDAIDIIKEARIKVDMEGYYKMMEKQKETSRKMAKFSHKAFEKGIKTEFVGYETLSASCKVIKKDGLFVVLDKTPFYPEMGGQVGDSGILIKDGKKVYVEDTKKEKETIIHKIKEGELCEGDVVNAIVDKEKREGIKRAHTATHLLQSALREILGKDVKQQGSLVENDRLRFDFNYPSKLTLNSLDEIERIVNKNIMDDIDVVILKDIPIKEAKALGALAFFEDEYKELVRVVQIGDISKELCGGTHIEATGKIGIFKITKEGSVSSGIRRIEANTGILAHNLIKEEREILKTKIEGLEMENKEKQKEILRLKGKLLDERIPKIIENAKEIKGVKIIFEIMEITKNELLQLIDKISEKLKSGITILASKEKGKIVFVCRITKDLTNKINADFLIKEISTITGGAGGGRQDFATGGGSDISKIKEAKKMVERLLEETF